MSTNRPGDARFYRLLDEIANLHARKSQDYSPGTDPLANFKASAEVGVRPYLGILTRLRDKQGRIQTFAKSGQLQNESARDSHIDSAVYHLLAIILLEDEATERELPSGADLSIMGNTLFGHGGEQISNTATAADALLKAQADLAVFAGVPVSVAGSDEPTKVYVGEDGDEDAQWRGHGV